MLLAPSIIPQCFVILASPDTISTIKPNAFLALIIARFVLPQILAPNALKNTILILHQAHAGLAHNPIVLLVEMALSALTALLDISSIPLLELVRCVAKAVIYVQELAHAVIVLMDTTITMGFVTLALRSAPRVWEILSTVLFARKDTTG